MKYTTLMIILALCCGCSFYYRSKVTVHFKADKVKAIAGGIPVAGDGTVTITRERVCQIK